ncbi:hypothetical protein GH733_002274 [Mirounga leonina]|nr:hypothetical protein GH733_002274 [Mirounga leonina]
MCKESQAGVSCAVSTSSTRSASNREGQLRLGNQVTQETVRTRLQFQSLVLVGKGVLVERSAAKTITKRGIMIPGKSQGKVLQATVLACWIGL